MAAAAQHHINYYCGNCAQDCCCACQNEHCGLCKKHKFAMEPFPTRRCANQYTFKDHYACFTCCKIHKGISQANYDTKDTLPNIRKVCAQCRQPTVLVSPALRFPKAKNKKGWGLLEKILTTDFSHAHQDSLAAAIQNDAHARLFYTVHCSDQVRALMYYPCKVQDYTAWVVHMTKLRVWL